MYVIFMPKHLLWQRPQCVHILSLIMNFHTVNMYCSAVITVRVSIFLTDRQIISIQKQHVRSTDNGITPLKDKKICHTCKQKSSSDEYTKIYTRKKIVMTETTIYDFHTIFYIPVIKSLDFRLPQVHILGTTHILQTSQIISICSMFS